MRSWRLFILLILFLPAAYLQGQRTYAPHSILATGDWYKIATSAPGIYKLDLTFLTSIGLKVAGVPNSAIRLYGNGGAMLPEANTDLVIDDLQEVALQVVDDGDGIFNGSDYFLFYAPGPDRWIEDSVNRRFFYQKNLYENLSYFFISIGGIGKRIGIQQNPPAGLKTVTSYNARIYHELDTVNFLASGKQWYGEEFTSAPGRLTTRSFPFMLQKAVSTEPGTLVSNCISRSLFNNSQFSVTVNNSVVLSHDIPRVGSTNLDIYARESEMTGIFTPGESIALNYNYQPGGTGAQGWLNWFALFYRAELSFNNGAQFRFRDWSSLATGSSATFIIKESTASTKVWDLTDPLQPLQMQGSMAGTNLSFSSDCSRLREYIAFNGTDFKTPVSKGKIPNQDLHGNTQVDYLIVSTASLTPQAKKLAEFHRQKNNLSTLVVDISDIYNEFSSGSADPVAIRNFTKMFYDRSKNGNAKAPSYLLLMGDASYNYKGDFKNIPELVPAFESSSSLDPLASYTSDDFYGFLDDSEDINKPVPNTLDIGIGRIPARTATEANNYLSKILAYNDTASLGKWRNEITFVADDEDFNLHLHDAEALSATVDTTNRIFHQNKIYLDAYPQESNASGSRYPLVNEAIRSRINNGTLIWNYSGHGGFRRLAEEVILDADVLNTWNNPYRLPLLITATCDFAPFDNPANFSLGENVLLRPNTGAIALMTTTRLVFAFSNRIINNNYLKTALVRNAEGKYPSLGEAVKKAKNLGYQNPAEVLNNLKFTLLGDPALTLSFPAFNISTDQINGKPADSLRALEFCTLNGSVKDIRGQVINDFNGKVYTSVYDKVDTLTTLANDPQSLPEKYPSQQRVLFKGETEVKSGRFSVQFIVPKDIDYKAGRGAVSYYATNGLNDASGYFSDLYISGSQGAVTDLTGPGIKGFLNSESFTDGGATGSNPILLLKLKDSSGINITGSAIGHDVTAVIDENPTKMLVLNDYFIPVLNSYQEGVVRFQLPALEKGPHTIRIRAWDVANNSSEIVIHFVVTPDFSIFSVTNFPNPFRHSTTIRFIHDLDTQQVGVKAEIFTLSGMHVKSFSRTINTTGSRSGELEWDGKNDMGLPVFSGMYLYRLTIISENGTVKTKTGKMIRL
ncbi:MAG: type IX secretion system sortase PorU [Chitinophagaceae bacterium]